MYCIGPLLIVITSGMHPMLGTRLRNTKATSKHIPLILALGLKDLLGVHHCTRSCRQPQMLLPAGFFADACASLSLGVNLLATALIGYKTWCVTLLAALYSEV